jgi:KEOPS complex subunit Cgi121
VLKKIEEFEAYVEIIGFRNMKIGNPQEFLRSAIKGKPADVETQFFEARNVASWQHLYFAALNALTAFSNETNISRTLGMEALLYAAGERQIIKATEKMGIKPGTREIAVLIVGNNRVTVESAVSKILRNVAGQQDDMVLELSGPKNELIMKAFKVDAVEVDTMMRKSDDLETALVDLVIERMALVSCER